MLSVLIGTALIGHTFENSFVWVNCRQTKTLGKHEKKKKFQLLSPAHATSQTQPVDLEASKLNWSMGNEIQKLKVNAPREQP
jgi:hypothetical protein